TANLIRAVPAPDANTTGQGLLACPVVILLPVSVPRPWVIPGVSIADRKSTRLNSSHVKTSYAVFCLKKKNSSVACGLYVAKYVNKRPDMDLADRRLRSNDRNDSLKTKLQLLHQQLSRIILIQHFAAK